MNEVIEAISNFGMSAVLLAWMIYKDYKFNESIVSLLDRIQVILGKLETWHSAEAGNEDA